MRKLVAGTFLTVDGVMQAPGAPEEDPSGGFPHGGWSVPFFDATMGRIMEEWMQRAGGFLLGRKTYEIFAAYWPQIKGDPIAEVLNNRPKYVASRSLTRVTWQHSTLIQGDLVDAVRRMKREPGGELQIHGSGNMIQALLRDNLVDEFRLWISPVVLGSGKRLFSEGAVPARLELVETQKATTGAVLQVYRRAGTPAYGSSEEIDRKRKGGR